MEYSDNKRRPFVSFLDKVGDLILLNLLFLLGSLPLLTVGTSASAMYYVTLRLHRGQSAHMVREFFHAYRQNLRQGILLELLWMLLAAILTVDVYVLRHLMEYDAFFKVVLVLLTVLSVRLFTVLLYTYPVLAQFDNTVWGTLTVARTLSLKNPSYTLAILLVTAFPAALGALLTYVLEWEVVVFLLVGFAALARFCTRLFVPLFDRYIAQILPPEGGAGEEA